MRMNKKIKYGNNKKIHILHAVPGLGPGGMELAMARVIRGLTGEDMRHSIVCLKGEPEIAGQLPRETEIHCFHARPNEPQLPFRLAGLIRKIRPSVIHARNWGAWPDMAVGRLLVWPIVPFIYSFHGLGKAYYMPWRRRLASYFLSRITTCLCTVSEQSKQLMTARWGWPEHRVQVIPNGVDTSLFYPSQAPPQNSRLVIGTVGNLRPVKNHALLIRSCSELLRRGIDLELRIAGEGEERENLLRLANSMQFNANLKLCGHIQNIPDFLRELDIFILCSDSEQHPNALCEAMACGIPCIATRVGCAEEILENGTCGHLISPGDQKSLTDAINDLMKNPDRKNTFCSDGCRRIREQYSLERMLASYAQMYRTLAASTGDPR